MTDEKMIEEIAQFIDSCETRTYNECLKVAKYLVEKLCYRKIPKNSVVITREQLEILVENACKVISIEDLCKLAKL